MPGEEDGAKGAAEIVYAYYEADYGGGFGDAHGGEVGFVGVDEGHHALVVAVEGDGCGGEEDYLGLGIMAEGEEAG